MEIAAASGAVSRDDVEDLAVTSGWFGRLVTKVEKYRVPFGVTALALAGAGIAAKVLGYDRGSPWGEPTLSVGIGVVSLPSAGRALLPMAVYSAIAQVVRSAAMPLYTVVTNASLNTSNPARKGALLAVLGFMGGHHTADAVGLVAASTLGEEVQPLVSALQDQQHNSYPLYQYIGTFCVGVAALTGGLSHIDYGQEGVSLALQYLGILGIGEPLGRVLIRFLRNQMVTQSTADDALFGTPDSVGLTRFVLRSLIHGGDLGLGLLVVGITPSHPVRSYVLTSVAGLLLGALNEANGPRINARTERTEPRTWPHAIQRCLFPPAVLGWTSYAAATNLDSRLAVGALATYAITAITSHSIVESNSSRLRGATHMLIRNARTAAIAAIVTITFVDLSDTGLNGSLGVTHTLLALGGWALLGAQLGTASAGPGETTPEGAIALHFQAAYVSVIV